VIDAGTKSAPGAPTARGLRARLGLAGPDQTAAGWGLGWVASLVVLAALLVSAAHWRAPIMQHWPPSIRLYTALGAQAPRS
jgi:hypothetical protein